MSLTRRDLLRAACVMPLAAGAACQSAPTVLDVPLDKDAQPGAAPVHPLTGLVDFTGAAITLPRLINGVTLVDFWASWCGPCRQAFRYLDQLFRTYRGEGLQMIAVSTDADPAAARRYAAAARPRFPLAWDMSGEVRERLGVSALPTTLLFDSAGSIVVRNEGFDLVDHRLLEEQVHRLLRP